MNKAVDNIQERLTSYACALNYADLAPQVIHAAKVRIIDTLGALIGGFHGEPCRIARNLAAQMPNADGATVIGTRIKTTPDMAAFVNATTARYVELNDTYHWPGSYGGHPSDVITPVLAAAEHAHVNGHEFITGVVLAYEVFLRFSDVLHNEDFDNTTFGGIASAVAAARLLGLSANQISHCISIAAVPNNILRQVRVSHLSMFKAAAAGQAGRGALFAALLARGGMEGPHLPFEGNAGWCEHVARERFSLATMGNGANFKILDSRIKNRPSNGATIASILAAEKVAPLRDIHEVEQVTVEVYKRAKEHSGTDERAWNPDSWDSADHSIPYVVAATLMDGTVTPRSFNNAHLWNPELRALMRKVAVLENESFTRAYERLPVEHRSRVTIVTTDGKLLMGEVGGDEDDLTQEMSDGQIEKKFSGLAEELLGVNRVKIILDRLWHLDEVRNVSDITSDFVIG